MFLLVDSLSDPSSIVGTAIYVYFILANSAPPGITTMTAVNFTLDDQPPVAILPSPDAIRDFQYNVMLWSQTGLPLSWHTLIVSTSGLEEAAYVNFDYATYTLVASCSERNFMTYNNNVGMTMSS